MIEAAGGERVAGRHPKATLSSDASPIHSTDQFAPSLIPHLTAFVCILATA